MRIYFILSILILSCTANANDFCNCYLGLDPGYNKNTIAIRNSWRSAEWQDPFSSVRTTHTGHNSGEDPSGSLLKETFLNTELFVKYSPVSKLRLIMTLPFSINTLEYEGRTISRSAFSDLTLLAMYQLTNSFPSDSNSVSHRIFAGGGVKFPTGKSEGGSGVEIPLSHHLYSGTGSTDFLLNVSYIGKKNRFGWNLDASYKLNGESANDYRYGNTLNITPSIFYEVAIKSLKIYPHLGGAYESGGEDEFKGDTWLETGGETMYGTAGLDAYLGRFSVTTDFRLPVYHDLGAQKEEDKFVLFTSLNVHF